jgi:hypothetical protein
MSSHHYARPALAAEMARLVSGRNKFDSEANGLFLAAPRRTGKSTFLRGDLAPALRQEGVEVIYLDFWGTLTGGPAEALYAEVSRTLLAHKGIVARLADKAALSRVQLGTGGFGLEFDPARIGQTAGSSLTAAFRALVEATGRGVAVILDEAQELLASAAGDIVLKELKAARDTLNLPGDVKLMLVMSGSDRDKLGRILNTAAAPFWGSRVRPMPPLDDAYVRWVGGELAVAYPSLAPVSNDVLAKVFAMLGHRPAEFDKVIGEALLPMHQARRSFEDTLLERAQLAVEGEEAVYADRFMALTPTQRAVLTVLMERGEAFSPFRAETLAACERILHREVSTSSVQSALNKLRAADPPLIWKSNRGEYALDDNRMIAWYQARIADGGWPPGRVESRAVASGPKL